MEDGQRYRASVYGTTIEFVGAAGWLAFAHGNSLEIRLPTEPAPAGISIVRLHDARPEGDLANADPTGLAIPNDPFASQPSLISSDGVPNLAAVRGLPADWFGYVDSLPGMTLSDAAPGRSGGIEGDRVKFAVSGLAETPTAMCATTTEARCVLVSVELSGAFFWGEGDAGQLLLATIDGERFEISTWTNSLNAPSAADLDELAEMASSVAVK